MKKLIYNLILLLTALCLPVIAHSQEIVEIGGETQLVPIKYRAGIYEIKEDNIRLGADSTKNRFRSKISFLQKYYHSCSAIIYYQ